MRTLISIVGLVMALTGCSQGTGAVSVYGPGPSDPAGPPGDSPGPSQDGLAGPPGGAGGATSTGSSSSVGVSSSSSSASSSSSSGATLINVSCDVNDGTNHTCAEEDGVPAADQAALATSCASDNGTVGTACPTLNLLGTCTQPPTGGVTQKVSYYSDGATTAAEAQTTCTSGGGTWM